MEIHLDPKTEAVLNELARQQGLAPNVMAADLLRERITGIPTPIQPQDEWERRLLGVATDCGVSLPHSAVSSEGLYD